MTLRDGHELFIEGLNNFLEQAEIDFIYKSILKNGLNLDPIQLSIKPFTKLNFSEEIFIKESLLKIIAHEPLQYVVGIAHFRDIILKVDKRVLIPRTETEELVNWVLDDFETLDKQLKLIDMGTGSGCIGIALAKAQPFFSVYALDRDNDILELTLENAKLNRVQIKCVKKDMTLIKDFNFKVNVIVSNPPYVMINEKKQMKPNVLLYEPHKAIFVSDADPLLFYRMILEFASKNLKPKGYIYFEINPLLVKQLKELIATFSYTVLERLDIFGKPRMLRLKKK